MASVVQNPSLFLSGPGNAHVGESPYPILKNNHDVIIRIAFVGVCGSDVRLPLCRLFKANSVRSVSGPKEVYGQRLTRLNL